MSINSYFYCVLLWYRIQNQHTGSYYRYPWTLTTFETWIFYHLINFNLPSTAGQQDSIGQPSHTGLSMAPSILPRQKNNNIYSLFIFNIYFVTSFACMSGKVFNLLCIYIQFDAIWFYQIFFIAPCR